MPFSSRTALALIFFLAGCSSSGADDEGSAGSPQGGSSAAGQGGASAGGAGTAGKGGTGGVAGQLSTGGAAGAGAGAGGSGGKSGGSGGKSGSGGTSAGGAGSSAGGKGGTAGSSAGGNAGAPAGNAGTSGQAQGGTEQGGEAGQGGAGGEGDQGGTSGQAGSEQAGGQAGSEQAGGQAGGGQGGQGPAGGGSGGSAGSGGQATCDGAVGSTLIRLNQVGYRPADTKQAMFMGTAPGGTFVVRNAACDMVFQGPIGADLGSWSAGYPHVHALDFSSVTAPGTYTVEVPGSDSGASPPFQIGEGAALYGPLLDSALFFFKAQRDGADVDPAVLGRKPSHLDDAQAFLYSKPTYNSNDELTKPLSQIGTGTIDVSGGWFDAGDYLKFVETTSYTAAMMLVAVRDHAATLGGGKDSFQGEGRHGIEWLLKMWDDSSQTLYYQVGIGNGSEALKINGDHDLWRLPEVDDTLAVAPGDPNYFVRFRPALRLAAAGGNISPNLAGRLAADFALCSVVYRATDAALADSCLSSAEHVYALAHTTTSPTITTTAPKDYYPETSWRDDMELGATELYFAVAGAAGAVPAGLPHSDPAYYLGEAAKWAHDYLTSKENGSDSLNLYDVSALAHYELFRALSQAGKPSGLALGQAELVAGLASQLEAARTQGQQDPFRLGIEYGGGDAAPHAFGLALSADFYEEISGDTQYRSFGQQQRDWALGANAWGSSFVVGAGSTFPRCLQHQIANLVGSFDGSPPILRGAVVAGPTDPASLAGLAGSLLDGMKACPASGTDPFAPFSGHGAQYQDNAADWPTVEPAIDYTAPSILLFARQ